MKPPLDSVNKTLFEKILKLKVDNFTQVNETEPTKYDIEPQELASPGSYLKAAKDMIRLSFVDQKAHILSLFGGYQGFKDLYLNIYSLKHEKQEV